MKSSGLAKITSCNQPPTLRGRENNIYYTCKIKIQMDKKYTDQLSLSSKSEVITVLNRTDKMRTRSMIRLNMKRLLVKTTKPHKIRASNNNYTRPTALERSVAKTIGVGWG